MIAILIKESENGEFKFKIYQRKYQSYFKKMFELSNEYFNLGPNNYKNRHGLEINQAAEPMQRYTINAMDYIWDTVSKNHMCFVTSQ